MKRARVVESRLVAAPREVREAAAEHYGTPVNRPAAAAALFSFLESKPKEELWIAMLDGKHCLFALAHVSTGTLTSSLVHPREVFGPAIRMGAAAIVLAHNHPSGDAEPSAEDYAVTKRIREAGTLLGIPLLDHIVIGDGGHARAWKD